MLNHVFECNRTQERSGTSKLQAWTNKYTIQRTLVSAGTLQPHITHKGKPCAYCYSVQDLYFYVKASPDNKISQIHQTSKVGVNIQEHTVWYT